MPVESLTAFRELEEFLDKTMGRKIQWFSQTFEQGRPCSKYTPNRTQHFLKLTQLRFRCQDTPSDLHSMRARLRRLWHAPKREPAAATPRRCCAEFHFCLVTDVLLLGGSCCLAIKITKLDVDSFLVDLKNTNLQGRITSGPPKCAPTIVQYGTSSGLQFP